VGAQHLHAREKAGAKVICSGKDAGAFVPGALIVRADYAKEQPQNVAKFLAIYLRAWKWMGAHPDEAIALMKKFYEEGGVSISEASMKKEFSTRPVYDLAGQLKVMNRTGGKSDVDGWMTQISDFMKAAGTLPEAPVAGNYVTDQYMKLVDNDPRLKEFANRAN
jgi:NitT/TauT family transport system substrate-binding protein